MQQNKQNPSDQNLISDLRTKAKSLGFEVLGFAKIPDSWAAEKALKDFIENGHHGSMDWLEASLDRRSHPHKLWQEAKTAIVLGLNYGPDQNPLYALENKDQGVISVYALNEDYHDLIKKRLKQLVREVLSSYEGQAKVFVDTAALMEKPLAVLAGLGWQGKHTNLVSRDFGSWLFLGLILTDLDLPPGDIVTDHCGSCRACLDICPTNAFPAPYRLDARACISYLTIEHKGPIDQKFRKAMGNRIYGCDDCLAVCPWNKFAQTAREMALHRRESLKNLDLITLVRLSDQEFRKLFSKSPIKRIGRNRFVRNVIYALGNSENPGAIPVLQDFLEDEDATLQEAAVWALGELERGSGLRFPGCDEDSSS